MCSFLDVLKSNGQLNKKLKPDNNKALTVNNAGNHTLKQAAENLRSLGAGMAALQVQDLQAFWLSIMANEKASNKERLQASKLYADSIGAFEQAKNNKQAAPAVYSWGTNQEPVEAEIIQTKVQKDG